MNQKICYLMVGVSGSGKSTVVKGLLKHHPNAYIFSLDALRLELYSAKNSGVDEKQLYSEAFSYANQNKQQFDELVNKSWAHARTQEVIIIDNMNHTRRSRARWVTEARKRGFTIVAVNVIAPLDVVIARQTSRTDKSVPVEIVRQAYFSQQEVQSDEADFILNVDGTAEKPQLLGSLHF